MDDFNYERVESAIAESISFYNSCVPSLEGAENTLQDLLTRKQELRAEYLAVCEEKLILSELLKHPDRWTIATESEREESEAKEVAYENEMKALLNVRVDQMMETVEAVTEVFDTWRCSMDKLSQKIEKLKTKKLELEDVDLNPSSLSLHHMEVRNKLKQVVVLLEAAEAGRETLRERLVRMEDSLQYLLESQSQLERKHSQQKTQLHSLTEMQDAIQKLSGIECRVVDESKVRITLQPSHLMDGTDIGDSDGKALHDCKFTADLIFAVNGEGSLEISEVQTEHTVEEVQRLITQVKQDKDLPKFILGLQNTWLSHLPLNLEVSCLRKNHAIDFRQELGVLQLIIHKRSVVCSLNVPKSYPHADVTLASVTGHPHLTADDIHAPQTKSLTAWVRHLEDLLGQKQEHLHKA